MLENKQIAIGLILIAALVALVALVAPWWALDVAAGGASVSEQAGPFNTNDDMIDDASALVTGFLALVAFLGLAAAAGLMIFGMMNNRQDNMIRAAPLVAIAGAVVLIVALLLAIFMYPGDGDLGFWDSASAMGASVTAKAAWGWYMGIAAVLLGLAAGALSLGQREERPVSATQEGSSE